MAATAPPSSPTARERPHVYNILAGQAEHVHDTPYGSVGIVYSGSGIEAEWVSKQNEERDPEWFSQKTVDLLLVLQGQLRVEFECLQYEATLMQPGDLLVLPPNTRCRAYHWPPESRDAAVFFAAYPKEVRDPGLFTLHRWCTSEC